MKKVMLILPIIGATVWLSCNKQLQKVTTPLKGLYFGDSRDFIYHDYAYVDVKDSHTAMVDIYFYVKKATFCYKRDTLKAHSPGIYKSDLYTLTHSGTNLTLVNNIKMPVSSNGFRTFRLEPAESMWDTLNSLRKYYPIETDNR